MTMSLFDSTARAALVARISAIEVGKAPEWGKMSAAQMCAHCRVPLRIAAKELTVKRSLIGRLLGPIVRRSIANDKPFGKNLPTGKEFIVADDRELDVERAQLLADIERFGSAGPAGIPDEPHPFFGKLTPGDWDRLMWKHLDHHARQFGV